ncbi:MAG: large conductance mechanosensitive channel protein MscL [Alphaproteobacteria bacterium]|nr:large conductance mechanosensitive channel protein MscL [Alphaproteobacteria bacterium]MBV9419308.1 large conductance mechanosensitive channel protein MscL [Alphaproteobacteria bacterium]MBV9539975.1 large conductance mechanosensitive channel protein MscL [Alphaproteobacteria bacterium]MBV9904304.1 large conductance mechanosensitive channel protein MscL [Alphaproteobacteria bacterium]
MFKEFRTFIMRGNVVDLAVGVMIGAAFGGIVASLVKDILTPPLGLLLGGIDLSNFFIVLKGDHNVQTLKQAAEVGAVTLNYGLFLNAILNFLIIAFVLFLVLRQINRLKSPPPDAPAAEVPQDIQLLREIRDLLKARAP